MSDGFADQDRAGADRPSVAAEIGRGAKYGGLAAGCITGVIALCGLQFALVAGPLAPDDAPGGEAVLQLVKAVGAAATGMLLAALYGAVVGGVVFGVRASFRAAARGNEDP